MMLQNEIIQKNKGIFITILNKFLDTIYDDSAEEETTSTAMYEDIRKKLIDETELTKMEFNLIAILVSYELEIFKGNVINYTRAVTDLSAIYEDILVCLEVVPEMIEENKLNILK